ncbi:helix-turn-helix transcriptional regulator [Streptomyces albogriseolus]|uniref:helix-turn-helix transcriptional regulator n=1 Tax=Streptomyces albogriseolus TaxID=1887 RepID=UPI003827A375
MATELLSIRELAEFLGVPIQTIYCYNYDGSGPRRIKFGKHVRYRRTDVEKWLEEHTVERAA